MGHRDENSAVSSCAGSAQGAQVQSADTWATGGGQAAQSSMNGTQRTETRVNRTLTVV